MTIAKEATIIDGLLKEVGSRLFWDDVRPIKARRTVTGIERRSLPRESTKSRPDYISRTIRKVPEVMVKISGGPRSQMHVKAHLDYISRNGAVALEDENGDLITGKEAVRDVHDLWRWGGYPISDEIGHKVAFSLVLSMPPDTDRKAVTDAARDFAKAEFGDNYSYVFATHSDEKHPHVHLAVKAMGRDGIRLNPRKPDLQRWREIFADKLKEHGIEANATKRQVRGITRKPKKQPVIHLEKRGLRSFHREALKKAAESFVRNGQGIANPMQSRILRTRKHVVANWNAIGHALQAQGEEKLSAEVKAFVKALPSTDSVGEQLERQLRVQINKHQPKEKGSAER